MPGFCSSKNTKLSEESCVGAHSVLLWNVFWGFFLIFIPSPPAPPAFEQKDSAFSREMEKQEGFLCVLAECGFSAVPSLTLSAAC